MKYLVYLNCLLSFCFGEGDSGASLSNETAQEIISEYSIALQSGNVNEITKYWDGAIGQAYFASLPISHDLAVDISNPSDISSLKGCSYLFDSLMKKESYYEVHATWSLDEGTNRAIPQEPGKMIFYATYVDGKWLFADPAILFTANWIIYETGLYKFHYPKSLDFTLYSQEFNYIEAETQKLLDILDISLVSKIDYYRVTSREEVAIFTSSNGANGICMRSTDPTYNAAFDKIVSHTFSNLHEVVHALTAISGIPDVNMVFLEGFPVALGGATFITVTNSLVEAQKIIRNVSTPSLSHFFDTDTFLKNNEISYYLSGSFIHYLIRNFGMIKLLNFFKLYKSDNDLDKSLNTIYGNRFTELEKHWRKHLLTSKAPIEIGFTFKSGDSLVCQILDPEYDDDGPGWYRYPMTRDIPSGICDIVKLDITYDHDQVYFRVKFRKTAPPAFFPESNETISPAIFIALNRNISEQNQLATTYARSYIDPGTGYDMVITAGLGVSITNSLNKQEYISDFCFDSLFNYKNDELTFSINRSFLGTPDKNWKIFIGSGLQSDYGVKITYAPPKPVLVGPNEMNLWTEISTPNKYNPRFFDIIHRIGSNQKEILSVRSINERASLPMTSINDLSRIK